MDATRIERDTLGVVVVLATLDQFSRIFGVGRAKLERYGEHFTNVIREKLESNKT